MASGASIVHFFMRPLNSQLWLCDNDQHPSRLLPQRLLTLSRPSKAAPIRRDLQSVSAYIGTYTRTLSHTRAHTHTQTNTHTHIHTRIHTQTHKQDVHSNYFKRYPTF